MEVKYFASDYVVNQMNAFDKRTCYDSSEHDRFYNLLMTLRDAKGLKILSTKTTTDLHVVLKIEIKTYECKIVQEYKVFPPTEPNWFEQTILYLEWCDQAANRKITALIEQIEIEENAHV